MRQPNSSPFSDLPFGDLATSYGLLKMPRMPELKTWQVVNFVPDTKPSNQIKYK
jgi:hypothetical protein